MPKSAMKPLIGGTFIMLLLLVAVLGRIRRPDISSMKKELVKLVSESELRGIERQAREFKPVPSAR